MTGTPLYPRSAWRRALPPAVVYARHWARWAVGASSLTARLRAASSTFEVRLLGQKRAMPLRDEWRCLGMTGPAETLVREVLLACNGIPVVYAHTVVHPRSVALDWPFLKALGTQPLGHSLFADPRVERGAFEFALLDARHPLVRRADDALGDAPVARSGRLPARRSVFRRGASAMLVTEVFLPALAAFHPPR
ncbi:MULTISPECIES: chorismate--pyruvate lyase family protein [Ralstonia]|uniref:Probable chorismate pyruvate-lyase n=1 Tax=Ralstonia mannitolilytica TaxID=105219 RepID=A0AAJ4ZNK0_9RALS|nr:MULTISPECIES: chorismate lyase [Ralstonia]AJW44394.1 chorismate--pyruvate lyase [Ralstonia mannitolilytica]MBU9577650.1 chorismate lyase [Ralstonia mannitolilytica]PLT20103.1 chorismate lyase [Ralstonia mannitolilytica]QIF08434.1 chorismate lyase [Ralstonia mannitolilytica]CAG2147820.1 Chorismate pyruvate-lyase [Ralstonia mannitolilytica]